MAVNDGCDQTRLGERELLDLLWCVPGVSFCLLLGGHLDDGGCSGKPVRLRIASVDDLFVARLQAGELV